MEATVRSYAKTIAGSLAVAVAAGGAATYLLAVTPPAGGARLPEVVLGAALAVLALLAALVVAGGGVVLLRRRARLAGDEDLYLRLNRSRSERALETRGGRRPLLPRGLRAGDVVEILPRAEIERTLDGDRCLEGLPFMPEMERFCGTRARVYRLIDKIYDYGGAKDMRRLRGAVSLVGLRCDGAAHGGCQAACYLIWKTAWLRRATGAAPGPRAAAEPAAPAAATDAARYDCQYTRLVSATDRLSPRDPRQDLRPLLAGNVGVRAFLVAMLTRTFNFAQIRRGGTGFPEFPAPGATGKTPTRSLDLRPGDRVRVRPAAAIAATLNERGRNRGLWFDRDMLKFCGQEFRVERRVERIIDDATGKMLSMKTPCITLEDVRATGEYLRFCPQHDALFWREIWLERVVPGAEAGA